MVICTCRNISFLTPCLIFHDVLFAFIGSIAPFSYHLSFKSHSPFTYSRLSRHNSLQPPPHIMLTCPHFIKSPISWTLDISDTPFKHPTPSLRRGIICLHPNLCTLHPNEHLTIALLQMLWKSSTLTSTCDCFLIMCFTIDAPSVPTLSFLHTISAMATRTRPTSLLASWLIAISLCQLPLSISVILSSHSSTACSKLIDHHYRYHPCFSSIYHWPSTFSFSITNYTFL